MKSLHDHLRMLAQAAPKRAALLSCDAEGRVHEEITRAGLLQKVEAAGAYLQNIGLRLGDRVALEFGNSTELLVLSWAAWSMGVATVPLDTKRDTDELRTYKINTSSSKRVITQEEFSKAKNVPGKVSWMPEISHEALILFTSGTTAYPKGAQLSLQNLVVNAESIIEWLRIDENDRFLVELPLHHINSTTFCLASLIAGASIAIPPVYSNSRFFEQAAESGATFTSVVPSIIFDQLSRKKEFAAVKDRLKLTRIQLGSAPVVTSAAEEFIRDYGIPLYQGYGQTETALRVTGVPMDLSSKQYDLVLNENSIGTPMKWARVETADAEGKVLKEGEQGEILVKGPAAMQGYLGGEAAFRNGYFLTGDIGYWKTVAGRRFFFLVGRSKEIIIKGGVNISPVAVENALKKVSSDVEQAYAVGVADKRYGEEVGAVIVWKAGTDEPSALRRLKLSLLSGHKALRAYETPRYLATVRAEALPVTSTGKVQRTVLKKNLADSMESLYDLLQSAEFRFTVLPPHSPRMAESRTLYNHCWQPLVKNERGYERYLGTYLTLGAIDKDGKLAGQISFSYDGTTLTCVSICSASFKPKPVPDTKNIPDVKYVEQYLLSGNDPVMNFHHKLGAELVEVIPGGRPEDKSALGYTMLLRYPSSENEVPAGPASHQLIQAVRLLARDAGAEVTAVSRPGGLASYLATHHVV